ncbi:MAG: carbohydrate ABC transporter permease, partial [Roseibium sp.]|nr:carbohydrate ABC transporter permease [Roseibium sp.]
MFPRPIEKATPVAQFAYKAALPVALFVWLLPLLAIFLTSIRPAIDINTGNMFGIPSDTLIITIPTVILSVSLACLTGYALAVYRFRWALPLFFVFVAGNFVPFQILMLPVVDLSVRLEMMNTIPGLVIFHAAF